MRCSKKMTLVHSRKKIKLTLRNAKTFAMRFQKLKTKLKTR